MAKSYVKNIAVVGASGNVGKYITKELLATGKHTVTAITRSNATTKAPEGVQVAKVDYENKSSVVDALKGQEVLIISLSVMAPQGTQAMLIEAAAEAGVSWVMPNEYSPDFGNKNLLHFGKDALLGPGIIEAREHIERLGVSSWVGLVSGFWYPHVMAHPLTPYGFDIPNKTVTFFDDGRTRIPHTTLEQSGRVVAALLSLPVDGVDPCLSQWRNRPCYCSSFTLSQKEMFDAICAVTGDKESDWTIKYEPSVERHKRAQDMLQKGDRAGSLLTMVTRVFFQDGAGDYSDLIENKKLGIVEEDVHKVTRDALEMSKEGYEYPAAT